MDLHQLLMRDDTKSKEGKAEKEERNGREERKGEKTWRPFSKLAAVQTKTTTASVTADGTAGPDWFDMPATPNTPAMQRDLQLLRMRNALDPKRHYRRLDKELPKFAQAGQIVAGPTDYYERGRGRGRPATIVDELIADQDRRRYYRKKYAEIQTHKMSGRDRWKKKAGGASRSGRR